MTTCMKKQPTGSQRTPSYHDLFDVNLKYVEYLLARTRLSHSYLKNVQKSGDEVEIELRSLLGHVVPKRFAVRHGYIVSASDRLKKPAVSPQVDVIIIDTMVPHTIFVLDEASGMEVVPVEAVVGIMEIKRTVTKSSLRAALDHLELIADTVGIKKDDSRMFLPGGVDVSSLNLNGYRSNPLTAVLGLEHGREVYTAFIDEMNERDKAKKAPLVDLVASLSGLMIVPVEPGTKNVRIHNPRTERVTNWSRIMGVKSSSEITARVLGYILAYVQTAGGRRLDVPAYYFNSSGK